MINNQLDQVASVLKLNDYQGFKYHSFCREMQHDTYIFTFINGDKYFKVQITHEAIFQMTMSEVINYIDSMVRNHPDLAKSSHHQEFYNKFDELLK